MTMVRTLLAALMLTLPTAAVAQDAVGAYRARLTGFDPRQPVTPEMVSVVLEGLGSTTDRIRQEALDVLAAIVNPYRALMARLTTEAFHADAARLWPHESRVWALLDDPFPRVRAKAVEAAALL